MAITLTDEQFTLLWTYLDREHRLVDDPRYVGETLKLGERLWEIVREVAVAQDFTVPDESTAGPDALRPSAWDVPAQLVAKSRSSSRPAK